MRPTADYCHDFTELYRTRGSCRVRVFEWGDVSVDGDDAEAVVVLTDEPNSISSMRYNVEVIAAEVLLRFALPTSATAFVEHHTCGWCERRGALRPETFELVTFEVDEPECREVCPGRFVAALSGPEHHLLSFDVLDELVRPGLLHSVEDVRTQPGLHGGRPLNAATAAPPPVPSPILFSDRFTVVPKIREVCPAGLSAYLIPTYAALADYANNATGLCWPEMETLAWLLGCNEKTVRRHMQKLEEFGLVEKLERLRRPDGTFRGYKYRLPHIARAAERIL